MHERTGYITSVLLDKRCGFITSHGDRFYFGAWSLRGMELDDRLEEMRVEFMPLQYGERWAASDVHAAP